MNDTPIDFSIVKVILNKADLKGRKCFHQGNPETCQ